MGLKERIVICSGKIRPVAITYLQDKVTLRSWQQRGRVPEPRWTEWLQEVDAIYSAGNIRIDEALLQKAPKLQVIAQASVGYGGAAASAESLQSCPTLRDPMDCSLPGSSVHGILQARVLEWGAIPMDI